LWRGSGLRGFVSVNNVFDRRYIGSAFLNPDVVNGEPVAFEPGRPRELVIGMTVGAF
jgi:outer membrane receptor protein involved in Fe transport